MYGANTDGVSGANKIRVRADTLLHSLHVCNGKLNSMEMSPTCITLLCHTVSSTASTVADRRKCCSSVGWGDFSWFILNPQNQFCMCSGNLHVVRGDTTFSKASEYNSSHSALMPAVN